MLENNSVIVGSWKFENGEMIADKNCLLIDELITNELTHVADDESGWYKLFKNNHDSTLWELTYPNSDWQEGGPPTLTRVLNDSDVLSKYKLE